MELMKRDAVTIFLLFVIGDLITTALFLNRGGLEANPIFATLLFFGEAGVILIILIKLAVFVEVIVMMYLLLKINVMRFYKFLVYTTESLSALVVVSNLMVFFLNKNVFELFGVVLPLYQGI